MVTKVVVFFQGGVHGCAVLFDIADTNVPPKLGCETLRWCIHFPVNAAAPVGDGQHAAGHSGAVVQYTDLALPGPVSRQPRDPGGVQRVQ